MTLGFDAPDADWTDDYAWTRWRGPQPYPCPADWVLTEPEGTIRWLRYPGVGEGLETDHDVREVFEDEAGVFDDEAYNDARAETAFLTPETLEFDRSARTETTEWELTIDGITIFRRVDPDENDRWATTAEALARYAGGADLDDLADDLAPESGDLPPDVRRERDLERKREQNESLAAFEDGGEP